MDITLDRVAFVDDDESVLCDLIRGEGGRSKGSGGQVGLHYRLQVMTYHGADLLRSQLERAVADE